MARELDMLVATRANSNLEKALTALELLLDPINKFVQNLGLPFSISSMQATTIRSTNQPFVTAKMTPCRLAIVIE